jgi:hypothetical protein
MFFETTLDFSRTLVKADGVKVQFATPRAWLSEPCCSFVIQWILTSCFLSLEQLLGFIQVGPSRPVIRVSMLAVIALGFDEDARLAIRVSQDFVTLCQYAAPHMIQTICRFFSDFGRCQTVNRCPRIHLLQGLLDELCFLWIYP